MTKEEFDLQWMREMGCDYSQTYKKAVRFCLRIANEVTYAGMVRFPGIDRMTNMAAYMLEEHPYSLRVTWDSSDTFPIYTVTLREPSSPST